MILRITILIALVVQCFLVKATEITWTGAASDSLWTNAANWDVGQVPTASDSVSTFYGDYLKIPAGYTARCKYFKLLGRLEVAVTSKLVMTGTFNVLGNVDNYGLIKIDDSVGGSLYFSTQAASREFHNYGNIVINNSQKIGLEIDGGQEFTNHDTGVIDINNSLRESMRVEGIVHNYGSIRLRNSSLDIGLKLFGSGNYDAEFYNNSCGKLLIRDEVVVEDGKLINDGSIRQIYDGYNELTVGINEIQNFGLIDDDFGSFRLYQIDNFGVANQPNSGLVQTGQSVEILDAATPATFDASDLYLDAELTIHAGDYDVNTNIWIPTQAANGDSVFYMSISPSSSLCVDTVKVVLDYPVEGVTYWLGGSGNWQSPFRWNTGIVPTSNDKVYIYNELDEVTIPLGYHAVAKTVIINGQLLVSILGSLTLEGYDAFIAVDIDGGELINNGNIAISDCNQAINVDNGTLVNNSDIVFENVNLGIKVNGQFDDPAFLENHGLISQDEGNLLDSDESLVSNYGTILASKPTNASIDASNIVNHGLIMIEMRESTGYGVAGTIENHGSIHVSNTTGIGVGINGTLENEVTGIVILSNLLTGGILGGHNYGKIDVSSCEVGIRFISTFDNNMDTISVKDCEIALFLANGDVTNNLMGVLHIDQISNIGIYVPGENGSGSKFFNYGPVAIQNIQGVGLHIQTTAYNFGEGEIVIDGTSSHGILLDGTFSNFIISGTSRTVVTNSLGDGVLSDYGTISLSSSSVLEVGD